MNNMFKTPLLTRRCFWQNTLLFFSTNLRSKQISRPILKRPTKVNEIGPLGWLLLTIPASTFGLGVWQVKRKTWKENLIAELKERTNSDPVRLPESLEEINKLEYRPVYVRGTFLHDKELYLGPRTLLSKGDSSTKSSLMSNNAKASQGYLVITPLKLEDRDETILVNRGWVPSKKLDPRTRLKGQIDHAVDVVGILRLHENRPNFAMKNKDGSKLFFYRDLNAMCDATGASPIFLDQTDEFNAPEGPVGGQTRVTLRNEHLSYILTWFSLSGATSYMWYKKFFR